MLRETIDMYKGVANQRPVFYYKGVANQRLDLPPGNIMPLRGMLSASSPSSVISVNKSCIVSSVPIPTAIC